MGYRSRRCNFWIGGQFSNYTSTSWSPASNITAAGGSVVDTALGNNDIIGNITLNNFPLAIVRFAHLTRWENFLGLDSNSTVLNALFDAKMIGSRTWSLFWVRPAPIHLLKWMGP